VVRQVASALAALWLSALTGCGTPAPAPTPTPPAAPTATLAPTPNPTAVVQPRAQATLDTSGASSADVENAFLGNVDDVIAEAADLTVTPCADLTQVTRDNPMLLPSVRGFAAALKRVAASQAVLNTDAVKVALADLDHSMGELEGALSSCGIKPQP
jgi:hypothetical protein